MLFFITLIYANNCLSQTENINTDRPDQSDGAYVVPKNKFQIEDGFTIAKETFINNLLLRYGITNSTEIRLLVDAGKELTATGLMPVTVSIKQRLLKQHAIIPAISFVGYASFEQLASKDFQGDQIPFELKLAFENEITDQFSLGYNVGTSEKFKALNLTLNFGFTPTNKFSTFIEYFSTITKLEAEHNLDAGVLFLVNPHLQFDIACGRSISGPESRFFTTFGVSYIFR